MSELALKLIHENIKKHQCGENARSLDLGNCGFSEVPEEIGQCIWLEKLSFADFSWHWQGNEWTAKQSQNNGEQNIISHLPHSLTKLKNLNQLAVCGSNTNRSPLADISVIAELINLKSFTCWNTRLSDFSPLTKLTKLKSLFIGSTNLSNLTPFAELTSLQVLTCCISQVADLSSLVKLKNLQYLDCSYTQVSNLSPLSELYNLQVLHCDSTQVSDLSPLTELTQLQNLYSSHTKISDLTPLTDLTNLQCLNCSHTLISDLLPLSRRIKNGIPVIWQDHGAFSGILVRDCPLIAPPIEVAMESPQAVHDYFEELGHDGRKLNEVKIIFLGEASAGKTSLVKRLMNDDFNPKENQTHGIRIRKMPFTMRDGDTVTAHLWDFGGQEVMHATHQLFLSQRCIYVLLLNSRNDDQAEKWLKHAASFGGHSPVLVVLNKIDENPSFEVNRKNLRAKYPQIREFFRLSCQNGEGTEEFHQALCQEIESADTRRTPFPSYWLAVKDYFSNEMKADYIESAQYREICIQNSVSRQFSQDVLLQFLHDLGVVINFRNLKNFDTHILNPLWLTSGIYRIINSKIVGEKTKGLLHENDFDAVINDPRYRKEDAAEIQSHYPRNKLHYIVRIMQEFELCFMLDAKTYVIPQLLPVQEPDVVMNGSILHFVIDFPDFLPDSFFPRLIVKLHMYIEDEQCWRTGMVLHKPSIFNAQARARWDKEDQKILVDVCGEERRRLLSFIRETIKEIAGGFNNLKYTELVPIPGCNDTQDYSYLVDAEKAGETEIFIQALKKRVPISELLDGVEEPAMRDNVKQLPVKAFVSYAHKDLEHLKALRSALAPLIRLQKLELWDDRDINAGGDWEKVLFQQLEEADIVLCLVSSDFVASDFCYQKEFSSALKAHRRGEKNIVPIMLRKTDWKDLPLSGIQGTPGEWITSATNQDEAWTKVSESLRPILEQTKQRKHKIMNNDPKLVVAPNR